MTININEKWETFQYWNDATQRARVLANEQGYACIIPYEGPCFAVVPAEDASQAQGKIGPADILEDFVGS